MREPSEPSPLNNGSIICVIYSTLTRLVAWPAIFILIIFLYPFSHLLHSQLTTLLSEKTPSAAHHAMSSIVPGVVPASLSFFAIYNPSLSKSDDTFHEQIVYYYSKSNSAKRSGKANYNEDGGDTQEERNEKARQIGLAQGIAEFAK